MRIRLPVKGNTKTDINVTIYTRYTNGVVDVYKDHNLKTNDYLDLLRDIASGAETDARIKYMAWGTDTTDPAATQHALVAEEGRQQITTSADGTTGKVTLTTIMNSLTANGIEIGEFGLFAGSGATATADSGVMAARVKWSPAHEKTQLESIQVDWELTFS